MSYNDRGRQLNVLSEIRCRDPQGHAPTRKKYHLYQYYNNIIEISIIPKLTRVYPRGTASLRVFELQLQQGTTSAV